MKRLLSMLLTVCMIVSLFPAQVLAVEEAEQPQQVLDLPIVVEDAPMGSSVPEAVAPNVVPEKGMFVYQGSTQFYAPRYIYILDGEGNYLHTRPEDNGVVQMVDADGNVVASSLAVDYDYDYNAGVYTYKVWRAEFECSDTQDLTELPAGEYSLQLYAGNDTYACDGTIRIIGTGDLLIEDADIYDLYVGSTEWDLRLQLFGFTDEEELDNLSFELLDPDGNVVGSSSDRYRDFRVYESYGVSCWNLYAEMVLNEGYVLENDTQYTLRILYSGTRDLYSNATSAYQYAYTPSASIESFTVKDAQNSVVEVTFANWDSDTEYTVTVTINDDIVLSKWTGTIPDDGTLELTLTRTGSAEPMSSFDHSFYVSLYEGSYHRDSESFENPYRNMSGGGAGNVYLTGSYRFSASATQWTATLAGYNSSLYQQGGDVATLVDEDGEEVARTTDIEEYGYDAYNFEIGANFRFAKSLPAGWYTLYFNGEEIDTVRVVSGLAWSRSIPFTLWDEDTQTEHFGLNMGIFPITMHILNTSGKGTLTIRDANEKVILTSGLLTGAESDYSGHKDFVWDLDAEDFEALTAGETYTLIFTDNDKDLGTLDYELGLYDTTPILPDYASGDGMYIQSYNQKPGTTVLPVEFQVYDALNITEEDLQLADHLTAYNRDTEETFTVTSISNGRWGENGYYYYWMDMTFSAPLTEGYYEMQFDGQTVDYFSLRAPEEILVPHVSSSLQDNGLIYGYGLPADGVYTGKLYDGYTCLTETPFSLTYEESSDGDTYLLCDMDMLKALNLSAGEYELRLWLNGEPLGNATYEVLDSSLPIVQIFDSYNSDLTLSNTSGMYRFEILNGGAYTRIRAAESLEALEKIDYEKASRIAFWLSEGYGEKTVYAQLQTTDELTESEILTFKLWYLDPDTPLSVTVPEDIQGVYGGRMLEVNIGALSSYFQPVMEMETSDGSVETVPLNYAGMGQPVGLYPPAVHGLESAHPFGNADEYLDKSWSYTEEGASSLRVTFSPATNLEYGTYLYLYCGTEDNLQEIDYFYYYSTDDVAGQTFTVPGDTVTIRMTSNRNSDPCYGFAVTAVEAVESTVTEEEEAVPPVEETEAGASEEESDVVKEEDSTGGALHLYTTGLLDSESYYNLQDCETVRFYLKDQQDDTVSEVVERMLIFGNPDTVILPQFREGTVYSTADTYNLYGYATPGSTVTVTADEAVLATTTANTFGYFSMELTDLEDGYLWFTVEDDSGVTAATEATLVVDTVVPTVKSINFTFSEDKVATLRWVCEDSDVDHFVILKNSAVLDKNVSASSRTYSVTASADDGNFFTVRAVDYAGNVGYLTVSTADQEPPTAPESLTASSITTSSAVLTWSEGTDNIGIMGYVVYCDGEELIRLGGEAKLSYTVSGLEPGTDYSFTVKSRDEAGNLSPASVAAEVTTVDLIVTPNVESAYIVDAYPAKQIPVTFTVTPSVEDYTASLAKAWLEFRPTDTEDSWTVNDLSINGTGSWDISGSDKDGYLPKGSYDLYFHVTDSLGAEAVSEPVTVVVLKADDVPPSAPGTPKAVSHTTTSICFSWDAATDNIGVHHYEIWRNKELVGETAETEWNDIGLAMGTYSYTVNAVDYRGNTSESSPAAALSTMVLEFDSVMDFDDSYVLEEQSGASIPVWAKFKAEEGYTPDITMALQYRAENEKEWNTSVLAADTADVNSFTGNWDITGDVLGYLPAGVYEVCFSVSDGSAIAESDVQTVTLLGETQKPVIDYIKPSSGTLGGKAITLSTYATDNVSVSSLTLSCAPEGSDTFTEIRSEAFPYIKYTWDASSLPSGVYVIKATATDPRGNVGESTVSITVDNTPPAVPSGVTATGTSRYIHVMWDADYQRSDDFQEFRVYRATDTDGAFELVKAPGTVGYYDDGKTVTGRVTYYYYVTAVDVYGNESAAEQIVSAALEPDSESPRISDMLPEANKGLRRSATLEIIASDNYRLAKAVFSYKAKTASEWIEIGTVNVDGNINNTIFQLEWDIPDNITKGTYDLKAEVYDDSINDVALGYTANEPGVWEQQVTLSSYSLPTAPEVSVTAAYKQAAFTWTYGGDTDTLRDFVLYQTNASGGARSYVTSVVKGSTGECTAAIPATGAQYFVVVARDTYGAEKASAVISVTSAARESEPPVAVLRPETLTAAVGIPFDFSAINSTDNDEIVSYGWDFGDGSTGTGAACSHTYSAAGSYNVKLTVTDACGNVGTADAVMTVYDVTAADANHALVTVTTVNAYVAGTPAIAGTEVKITAADEEGNTVFETSLLSDADGKAVAVVPVGAVTVSAIAEGYISSSRAIKVEPDENGAFAYTLGLTPMNVSLVDGSLTVEEMTYSEILAAGIDVTHPDNNHVWKFAATLEFVAAPAFPFDLPSLDVTGYFNGSGTFLGGSGWGWRSVGGGGGGGGGTGWGMNIGIFPISEHFILVIYGEAHWLKEMYNVELLVINNSYVDDITDCKAALMLPDGLSLAAMTGKAQDLTIDLGTIPHKTGEKDTANTAKANWYLRGDKEGEYNLTASVIGRNPDIFVKSFTTDKPVKVYAGSALKLFITAGDIAYRGEEYHVQFRLQNVSHKNLYNLSFGITGAEQFKVVTMGDNEAELRLTHEDFEDNMTRAVDILQPGGSITIDFYTTTWFNSVLELADLGPFDVGYYLTNVFVTTLEGSTTSIPYEINIVPSSHGTFFEWLADKFKEDAIDAVIDLVEEKFLDEIPLISTAKKVFEFVSHGEADSRCVIQIQGGYVTSSNNFLRNVQPAADGTVTNVAAANSSVPDGALAIYTDAEEYTVSPDGKTLTLLSSGKIYVEGKKPGSATLTVTTTANEGAQEHVHTLNFNVSRGSADASDLILQEPVTGLTDGKAAIPLAGSTLEITFPYLLIGADGSYLTSAENAEWSVSGADTDGITVKNGIVTVQSRAKAGDYTVTLTVGEKSANQNFTLTREASVAQYVEISSGTAVLGDSYLLTVGSDSTVFSAQVIDQYGVVFDTPVTWSAEGSASVATASGGTVTPGSTSGTVTLSVKVNTNTALTDSLTVTVIGGSDLQVTETPSESGCTATVTNGSQQTVTLQALVAAYDADGRMVAFRTQMITLAAGGSQDIALTYPTGEQVDDVRVFLVNAASMAPISAAQ